MKMYKKSREEVIRRLEELGQKVKEQFDRGENPKIEIPMRSLSNVYFDETDGLIKLKRDKKQFRSYYNVAHVKKFMQTLLVAKSIRNLLKEDKTMSIRQMFYVNRITIPGTKEDVFYEQKESDPIIEDIEVAIDVLRENLNIFADSKGLMAGDLKIIDHTTGDEIDLSKMGSAGYAIPGIVEPDKIEFVSNKAKYVLVVEKGAVWARLNEDRYWKKNNCILLTGKGQPSRAERRMVRRLHDELGLPVYVFTDLDPWGYYIYSVYKQGSINLAHFSEKCGVPDTKFIGFKVSDVKTFEMPKTGMFKMEKGDYKRLDEIKKYPWFKNRLWQKEIDDLKKFGWKIESDALVNKGIEFTANTYLPWKMKHPEDFLP